MSRLPALRTFKSDDGTEFPIPIELSSEAKRPSRKSKVETLLLPFIVNVLVANAASAYRDLSRLDAS